MRVTNPPDFDYNTILLSWTSIEGSDHYIFENRYKGKVFASIDIRNNYYRLVYKQDQWNILKTASEIEYRVTAVDAGGNVIVGPTGWSIFRCN
jgi:hypothetical protein